MSELFLTKLEITKLDQVRHKLLNEYDIHKLVYRLFCSYENDKRKFLYFVDYGGLGNMKIIIQSAIPPVEISDEWNIKTVKIPDDFFSYRNYFFRLRFSPVIKSGRSIKQVLTKEEDLKEWLVKRSDSLGVIFDSSTIEKITSSKIIMPHKEGNIVLSYSDVTGCLAVTNREKFLNKVKNGIGAGKAFGFGLLQLTPQGGINE